MQLLKVENGDFRMHIISINLYKRLGNTNTAQKIGEWLSNNKVDLLLVQEPGKRGRNDIVQFPSYSYLGGSDAIGAWIHEKWTTPDVKLLRDNWQELNMDSLRIHNVYLSAYSSKERIEFLGSVEMLLLLIF
jgi:hypothetical protein